MNKEISREFVERASKVKLLLMDCDGVLTDGKLYFSNDGEELKVFHVHDGQGITNWHRAGYKSGIITGRKSIMLERRVNDLGIHFLRQNSKDKIKDFESLLKESNASPDEVAYVGDDISDLELLKVVNLPIVVGNCVDDIRDSALYITNKHGGAGAIREVTDLLLKITSKKK